MNKLAKMLTNEIFKCYPDKGPAAVEAKISQLLILEGEILHPVAEHLGEGFQNPLKNAIKHGTNIEFSLILCCQRCLEF